MDLSRFLDAQASVYADALAELHAGQKYTHWIWFILPQLRGLGHSSNATYYGLENAAEPRVRLLKPRPLLPPPGASLHPTRPRLRRPRALPPAATPPM